MKQVNLNISSEYLIIASELISIKTRKLLPTHQDVDEQEEEFINRVLEYKAYREMSDELNILIEQRNLCFSKMPSDISCYKEEKYLDEKINQTDLLSALIDFLKRREEEKPISARVMKKEYSVSKRIEEISSILRKKPKIKFFELFEKYDKPFVIVTFITILEMTKDGLIEVVQKNNDIFIIKKEGLVWLQP